MGRRGRSAFEGCANTFFVTTGFVNFARILSFGKAYYHILGDSLKFVLEEHSAILFAYVFMPSHIHFIIHLPAGQSISNLMRDFKKYTSTRIRQQLEIDQKEDCIEDLRRNASGRKHQFKLWEDRFDDVVIKTERVMRIKVRYIHQNPVRAGFVHEAEDWPFSSAKNYVGKENDFLPVSTDWH